MFNHIHVNVDSVEFEYVANGNLENISIARPDGISYSQWSGVWGGFVEFMESRLPTLYDYVERTVDTSELESLEDTIEDLRQELDTAKAEIETLESENGHLVDQNHDLNLEVERLLDECDELEATISRMRGED